MADKYEDKAYEARRKHGQKTCKGKKSFHNPDKARMHNKGQIPYKCKYCSKFHLHSMRVRKCFKKSSLKPHVEKQWRRIRHEEQKVKHKQWKSRQRNKSKLSG